VTGEAARRSYANGGLLPWIIGSAVRSASESDSETRLSALREKADCNEHAILRDAFASELRKTGFARAASSGSPAVLHLKITEFGVREVQRGFVVPHTIISARLISTEGKRLWSATAESSGVDRRPVQNYNAPSYCEDFKSVAEDIANQMIRGPIRPLEAP
jgi:hypothetical protein